MSRTAVLAELRAGIDRLEGGTRPTRRVLPVLPALAGLLPGRGLRCGGSYVVEGSPGLACALVAGPSEAGVRCAVVGMPTLSAVAAAELGVDLAHLVLVPEPGPRWLDVAGTLLDAFDVVVVQPPVRAGRVSDGEIRRLAARLREREAGLVVHRAGPGEGSSWPGREATITVHRQVWHGLGSGHGHLTARQVTVEVTGRGAAGRRRAQLWLPAPTGGVRMVEHGEGTLTVADAGDPITGEPIAGHADDLAGRRAG